MTREQAAMIIQKAWFEWKSWCAAQDAMEYEDGHRSPDPYNYNHYDETECMFF